MAVRLALLADHYRADRQWTDDVLKAGQQRLARWRAAAAAAVRPVRRRACWPRCASALADDLDTPGALALVDAWADDATLAGTGDDAQAPP